MLAFIVSEWEVNFGFKLTKGWLLDEKNACYESFDYLNL